MKKVTKNNWRAHVPATNVFWMQVRRAGKGGGQGEGGRALPAAFHAVAMSLGLSCRGDEPRRLADVVPPSCLAVPCGHLHDGGGPAWDAWEL